METIYIIAEIGLSVLITKSKKNDFTCKKNGANAAKFQTYKADTIVSGTTTYWDTKKEKTKTQYELLQNLINLMKKNMFL